MKIASGVCEIVVGVPAREYPLSVVKHAAYALTGEAYVGLQTVRGAVRVRLEPKSGSGDEALRALARRFREGLELERIRSAVEAGNRDLREHIIRLALRGDDRTQVDVETVLTKEQQEELDRLIAEVEAEVKKESGESGKKDPLGVTQTWEEKHGHGRTDP